MMKWLRYSLWISGLVVLLLWLAQHAVPSGTSPESRPAAQLLPPAPYPENLEQQLSRLQDTDISLQAESELPANLPWQSGTDAPPVGSPEARRLHLGIAIMAFFALVYAFGGEYLARVFSADEEVIAITAKLFVVVALFEVIDGTQVTMLGALRGLTDVKFPMYCAVVCYLLVEIPVGYLLGFKLGLGAEGIVGGFMAGISLAAVAFIVRFRKLTKNSKTLEF